jgi:tetratricopeptide (TPR) repeat protein
MRADWVAPAAHPQETAHVLCHLPVGCTLHLYQHALRRPPERPTTQHVRKAAGRQTGNTRSRTPCVVFEGAFLLGQTDSCRPQNRSLLFQSSHRQRPGYALAYAGLAEAYGALPDYGDSPVEDIPKAKAAAHKAIELDATLARPHVSLGGDMMAHDWDFAGGEAEFKKGLELDPNDAHAHEIYADNLSMIGGREKEAIAEVNRAYQLDPLSPSITKEVGFVYIAARQFDEGIAVCKKLANENPTFADAHRCLVIGYWAKHMYSQVIEEQKVYGQLSGDRDWSEYASAMEQGFRSGGWKGALRKGIEVSLAQHKTGYASAYGIATLYAELGDKEQAFRWLITAYQEHDEELIGLKTDYAVDPIRSDPRFAELVRKVGLPQ